MADPFRIAVIATKYARLTHADVIVTRWLEPFAGDRAIGWQPRTKIVSMYVLQTSEDDISAELCSRYGVARFSSVDAALTLGGDKLAVDGILLIGEHGHFPCNEFGQKLYPRKELFDQVIDVFHRSGRVVPLFFDKHLSWNMRWAHEMYWMIRDMKIPFFGGSSLPYSPMIPPVRFPVTPADCPEVILIYWNSLEAYLFHSLEIAASVMGQAGLDHCGVSSVTAWKERAVWDALDAGEFSWPLLEAAAASVSQEASDKIRTFRVERGSPTCAFQIQLQNGGKITCLMQTDLIRKWCLAFESKHLDRIEAAYVDTGGQDRGFPHFGILDCRIEEFFLTGVPPVPLERLYSSTMVTALCMHALTQPGRRISTPWLCLPVDREWKGENPIMNLV